METSVVSFAQSVVSVVLVPVKGPIVCCFLVLGVVALVVRLESRIVMVGFALLFGRPIVRVPGRVVPEGSSWNFVLVRQRHHPSSCRFVRLRHRRRSSPSRLAGLTLLVEVVCLIRLLVGFPVSPVQVCFRCLSMFVVRFQAVVQFSASVVPCR